MKNSSSHENQTAGPDCCARFLNIRLPRQRGVILAMNRCETEHVTEEKLKMIVELRKNAGELSNKSNCRTRLLLKEPEILLPKKQRILFSMISLTVEPDC